MRAMVFTNPSTVELQNVPEPEPTDGEILLSVAAVGICGSELHGVRSPGFRQPPLIMGHEFAGTTPSGERMVVNPLLSCGECDQCLRGSEHLCRRRQILGIHRPGAFAEYVSVPSRALHRMPAGMSFETAALIEPLANALHALGLAGAPEGARVAVIGVGTIGLVSLLVARSHTDDVTVCDLSEDRLEVAERLGASATTSTLEGEFDVIVDAVGSGATRRLSVELLRPGGAAVWVGLLNAGASLDGQAMVRDEKRVYGSYCYTPAEFEEAIELAERVPLDWATSFQLDEGVGVFTELMNGRQDVVKALLHP
jgi:threonine dehydrogenase-like Zn-dependent dehydrogenase